jgi:hypothetical protein
MNAYVNIKEEGLETLPHDDLMGTVQLHIYYVNILVNFGMYLGNIKNGVFSSILNIICMSLSSPKNF